MDYSIFGTWSQEIVLLAEEFVELARKKYLKKKALLEKGSVEWHVLYRVIGRFDAMLSLLKNEPVE